MAKSERDRCLDRLWSRLLDKYVENQNTGCWEYTGAVDTKGRGQIDAYGPYREVKSKWQVHRVAYEYCYGEIPKGECIIATCENPICFRPSHLKIGKNARNHQGKNGLHRVMMTKDQRAELHKKGRLKKRIPNISLTIEKINEIRKLHEEGVNHKEIAKKFEMESADYIWPIVAAGIWR